MVGREVSPAYNTLTSDVRAIVGIVGTCSPVEVGEGLNFVIVSCDGYVLIPFVLAELLSVRVTVTDVHY